MESVALEIVDLLVHLLGLVNTEYASLLLSLLINFWELKRMLGQIQILPLIYRLIIQHFLHLLLPILVSRFRFSISVPSFFMCKILWLWKFARICLLVFLAMKTWKVLHCMTFLLKFSFFSLLYLFQLSPTLLL